MEAREIYSFHFCCPLCGAQPGSVPLRSYLAKWAISEPSRGSALLALFSGALVEVCDGQSRWKTKKFCRAAQAILRETSALPEQVRAVPEFALEQTGPENLRLSVTCPVCECAAGPRSVGKYFTVWPEACRVQVGNLLYETGLILWGLVRSLPPWASGETLTALNGLRHKIIRAYRDMGMRECQQCGRPVTCLFGGTKEKRDGFCRHCADMGGGFWPGLRFEIGEDLSVQVIPQLPDPKAPARKSRDLLPPDFLR